jgi:hypothetical protein
MRPVDSRGSGMRRGAGTRIKSAEMRTGVRHGLRTPVPSSSILLAGCVNRVGSELEL